MFIIYLPLSVAGDGLRKLYSSYNSAKHADLEVYERAKSDGTFDPVMMTLRETAMAGLIVCPAWFVASVFSCFDCHISHNG
jgi:hypothetical protein